MESRLNIVIEKIVANHEEILRIHDKLDEVRNALKCTRDNVASLSEALKERLERALPYVNDLVWILTTAAKLGINSVIPIVDVFDTKSFAHPIEIAKRAHYSDNIIKHHLSCPTNNIAIF